jgi:hypothetical protein
VPIANQTLADLSLSRGETIDFALSLQADVYQWTILDLDGDGICCKWGEGRYISGLASRGTLSRPARSRASRA